MRDSAYGQWQVNKRSYGQGGAGSVAGAAGGVDLAGGVGVNADIRRGDVQVDDAVISTQQGGAGEGDFGRPDHRGEGGRAALRRDAVQQRGGDAHPRR